MTRVARQVADGGVGRRGLAAAGLADQAVRLARPDLERHAAQHRPRDAAHDVGERQVLDLEGGGRRRRRRRRAAARSASRSSFVQDRLERVGDQVDRDDRAGDGQGGEERRPPDARRSCSCTPRLTRQAPVGRRRLDADAEERQRRDREDRVAEADRHLDDGRAEDVREDLARQDEQARLAAQLGRRDVVELALGQDRRADRPRDDRREQDADDARRRRAATSRARPASAARRG